MDKQFSNNKQTFDLEERTAKFGETIIKFCKSLQQDAISASLIGQLVRCGTSIGANYGEANDAESKNWLRMLAVAIPECKPDGRKLWQEAKELNLIFSSILRTCKPS